MTTYDAIIVGAGVTGLGCAWRMAKRGWKVVVVEQGATVQNELNGSHGESRIIRMANVKDHYMPISLDFFRLWRELEAESGEKLIESNGVLWLADKREIDDIHGVMSRADIPHDVFHGAEIHRRFPHLDYGDEWWAVLDHWGGTIFARKCLEALHEAAEKLGVRFEYSTKVEKWTSRVADGQSGVVVTATDGRQFRGRSLVLATGAWTNSIAGSRMNVRVQPTCIPVFHWDIRREGRQHFSAAKKSPNLVMGGNGLKYGLFAVVDADYPNKLKFCAHAGVQFHLELDRRPAHRQLDDMRSAVSQHIRQHIDFVEHRRPAAETTCVYAITDDDSFIIDRHPAHGNVVIAAAFCGTGFKYGPVVGEIVADLCEGRKPKYDLTAFSATRKIAAKI